MTSRPRILFGEHSTQRPAIERLIDHARFEVGFGAFEGADFSHIDLVVPLRLEEFAAAKEANVDRRRAVLPDAALVDLCDDKLLFNRRLIGLGFGDAVPALLPDDTDRYPFVRKARRGDFGAGIRMVRGPADDVAMPDSFAQVAVAGADEYVLHLLRVDGAVRYSLCYRYDMGDPLAIRGGAAAARGIHPADPKPAWAVCAAMLDALGFEGTCCFNYKLEDGWPRILELNPRFGGSLVGDVTAYVAAHLEAIGQGALLPLSHPAHIARGNRERPMPTETEKNVLDRVLVLEMVRVTEAAAIAAATLVGRGDEKAADAAAVEAMREALNELPIDGTVVIGEGERDEAPMLFIGEKVGSAQGIGPRIDIALDPLEGTTICATAGPNALAVLAIAEKGGLLNAPDVYMDKIAVGPGYPAGVIDLDRSATENVRAVAAAKGVEPRDIIACVLDRPRHEALIAELRTIGCGIMLIGDGDVAGVIATTNPETTVDIYMGSGGAPEGVLAAAALRCIGGQFKGRLLFRNDDERGRAAKWGVTDLDKQYDLTELARGDCIFAATGVTDGSLLDGVKRRGGTMTTESVVMRASSGTVRWVKGEHRIG